MFKINTDLHTHTVASGHAYCTIDEMAKGAFANGVKLIAITDHGPNLPGAPHLYHFGNIAVVPDLLYGVRIVKSVEANILENGNLDLTNEELSNLEFVTAGIHPDTGHNLKNKKEYTEATIRAIENPQLDMITHPVQRSYPVELDAVAKAAAKNNVILELNASSYSPNKSKKRGIKSEDLKLLKLAKKYNCKLAVNSDAHFYDVIGDYSNLRFIFESKDFEPELIINRTSENMVEYLADRQKRLTEFRKTV